MQTIVYPGTFDPFTRGHQDIVQRAAKLFPSVVVLIAQGSHKAPVLTIERRLACCQKIFQDQSNIVVEQLDGLLGSYLKNNNYSLILRGLRDSQDYSYEHKLEYSNKMLEPSLETVYLSARPEYQHLSSTIVRDILVHEGDVSKFVPPEILKSL